MQEIFKDIPGYEGYYQVSDQGRVKSMARKITRGDGMVITIKERILKNQNDKHGYHIVTIAKTTKGRTKKVHQLVAMAFLGHSPCGLKRVVNHINFKKDDNRLINLEIISQRENSTKEHIKSASKFLGVQKMRKQWRSTVKNNGIVYNLGAFDSEEEAAEYYNNALIAIENGEEIIIKRKKNTSKHKDIYFNKRTSVWQASIRISGKRKYIGSYKTEGEAYIMQQEKQKNVRESRTD